MTGLVKRDGVTLVAADVRLVQITDEGEVEVGAANDLDEGRYRITATIPKEGGQYKIVASASGTESKASTPFPLKRKMEKEHEITPAIDLTASLIRDVPP